MTPTAPDGTYLKNKLDPRKVRNKIDRTTLHESLNCNFKSIDLCGHNTAKTKNTPIADIKYLRLDTCRFILAPKGPEGPSAIGGKLNPPVLELELLSKYSIII